MAIPTTPGTTMIRDTSAQDTALASPPAARRNKLLLGAALLLALAAGAASLASTWQDNRHSVSAARLRLATVTRGTLVRDAAVNGRLVAAVSRLH